MASATTARPGDWPGCELSSPTHKEQSWPRMRWPTRRLSRLMGCSPSVRGITTLQILNARGWTLLPWLPAGLVLVAAALGIQLWLAAHASGVRWSHVGLGWLWLLGAIVGSALVLLLVRRYLDGHRSEMPIALVAVFVTLGLGPSFRRSGCSAASRSRCSCSTHCWASSVLSVRRHCEDLKATVVEPHEELPGRGSTCTARFRPGAQRADPHPRAGLAADARGPQPRTSCPFRRPSYLAARDDALASIVAFLLEHCESSPVDVPNVGQLPAPSAVRPRIADSACAGCSDSSSLSPWRPCCSSRGPGTAGARTSGMSLRVAHAAGPLEGCCHGRDSHAAAATAIGAVGVAVVAALLYWVAFLIGRPGTARPSGG